MKEAVIVNEVGLRDGLQNQPRLVPTGDKLRLAEALIAAGVRHLEAASFVSPKAVPNMADGAEVTAGLAEHPDLELMALVPNLKGYERARAAGYRTIAVVLATTDTFNLRNLHMTREEAELTCEAVIAAAKEEGRRVRGYISGALVCPYDGPIPIEVTQALARTLLTAGADEISIADTTGAGNPRQLKAILTPLIAEFGAARFNVHLHDTRGMAVGMAYAALEAGVRSFDSSIGGLGGCPFAPGAAGNVATEDLVYLLEECGFDTGIDLVRLMQAVTVAEEITGQALGGRVRRWWQSQQCKPAFLAAND